MNPDCTNFNEIPDHEKYEVIIAILDSVAELWGEECFPAADRGDNRMFRMADIKEFTHHALMEYMS